MNSNRIFVSLLASISLVPVEVVPNRKTESDYAHTINYSNASPFLGMNDLYIYNNTTPVSITGKNQFIQKDYFARYEKIAKSEWFKRSYSNKSLGDIVYIEQ